MRLTIDTFNLQAVERMLCVEALNHAGSIVEAAVLLGITRHALKRRIIKHRIEWPARALPIGSSDPSARSSSPGGSSTPSTAN